MKNGEVSEGAVFMVVMGGLTLFVMALIGVIAVSTYLYEKNIQCPTFANQIERPYKYSWFGGGCFVQTSTGQWVHEKNYWNNPVLSN